MVSLPFCLILVTMTEKLKMTVAIYPMCYQHLGLDRDTTMYRLHYSNKKFCVF